MLRSIVERHYAKKHQECMLPNTHLNELKEIAKNLPSWDAEALSDDGRVLSVNVLAGRSIVKGLHKEYNVAVALAEADKGTIYNYHSHDEIEIVVVFEGKVFLEFNNSFQKIMEKEQSAVIPKGMPHRVEFLADSKCVVITVPAASEFPNGGRFSGDTT